MNDAESHNPSGRPPGSRGAAGGGRGAGGHAPGVPPGFDVDVLERGAEKDGQPQEMDRRLFMQLVVFTCDSPNDPAAILEQLGEALEERGVPAVLYEDLNDPRGIGVLSFGEDPACFATDLRPVLNRFPALSLRPEMTMLGRTYSGGYEQDLEHWIIDRPRDTVLDPESAWAVWYPLRRDGEFAKLEPREQGKILKEHAIIGRAYGARDLAHDVRLACHGLDTNDNDFVIGLIGRDLHPLSHVVQTMRRTKQTSTYIVQMGPFFVGRAVFRTAGR